MGNFGDAASVVARCTLIETMRDPGNVKGAPLLMPQLFLSRRLPLHTYTVHFHVEVFKERRSAASAGTRHCEEFAVCNLVMMESNARKKR